MEIVVEHLLHWHRPVVPIASTFPIECLADNESDHHGGGEPRQEEPVSGFPVLPQLP
jgi:hypothetical protein